MEAFGANVGQAAQRLGRSLEGTTDLAQQIADSQAETRVREADIALSKRIQEELTTGESALMKMQGQAFVDNAPAYLERIEKHARELETNPRNTLEAEMLRTMTARRLEGVRQQVGSQQIREAQFANKASAVARTETMASNAAYAYRDPAAYTRNMADLNAAVQDQLQTQGITDPASFQALRQEKLAAVHAYAIQDMVRLGETGQAQVWLDGAIMRREIDPANAGRLQEMLEKSSTELEIGALVEGEAPQIGNMTTASDELVAAVTYQESRGKGTAVSPKGAAGVMQVMPTTGPEAARLAKIAWQPERMVSNKPEDMEYQQKLGVAYLNAQLKRFGGSTVAALAAYNAGPEMVQDWIDGTNRTGKNKSKLKLGDPSQNPAAWAAAIPFAETKDYVAKITAKLGGTTRAPLPKGVMTVDDVETWVDQFPVKDRQAARSAGMATMNRNRAAREQSESDAWDAVQPYLRNGGTWTQIPKHLWSRVSPQHQTALMEAERKGEDRITSPETFDTIMSVMEQNPEGFKRMDLLKVAPDLSRQDFEQVRMWQRQARQGTGEWKRPQAQYTSINRLFATVAPPSLVNAKGPAKDRADQLKSAWWQALQLKQSAQQEPLTDDEIAEIGTRLVADVAVGKGMFGPKERPLYTFAPDMDRNEALGYSSIPAEEKSRVFRYLQQRSGRVPSVGEVLNTWRTLKAVGEL